MKKNLLALTFLAGGLTAWGQNHSSLQPANAALLNAKPPMHEGVLAKTLTCNDTIRYPQVKQQLLGASNGFSTIDIWQSDNEAFSQTFLLSGASLSIKGVELFGSNKYATTPQPIGTPSITVRASIYLVDANNVPTTSLGSGTITFTSTTAGYRYVNFASPITVSANYAIVVDVVSAGGVYNTYVNAPAPNQSYDEGLSKFKSSYYPSSGGNFVSVPTYTTSFTGGPYDFEALVAPIVSYTINTTATASPNPSCLGTPVTFTNTTTPSGILSNRMYNYQKFRTHFNTAPHDSTFVWDMGVGALIWQGTHSYTYATSGSKTPELYTLGGFWEGCVDMIALPVTVNPIPAVNAGADVTVCAGTPTTLSASGATTYSWNNGLGTGQTQTVSPTTTTTYTVTGTSNGCQNTDDVIVTVNPLSDASFSYSTNTICDGSPNVTPTAAAAGTYTATLGLVFANAATGEIDVAATPSGTYTITHSVGGTCPATSTQTVTITSAPETDFSYSSATLCGGSPNAAPVFATGASGGVFSSTAGLSINSTTGVINIAASTPGTYTVTNFIAASGSCPASSSITNVSVYAQPTAAVSGGGSFCGAGSATVTITLTGQAPFDFTYSNGTTPTTVTGHASNTYTITATTSGTYTVTSISDANCSNTGTGSATVNANQNPVVTLNGLSSVCNNSGVVNLTQGLPAGGTYSGTGVTGNTFTPSAPGAVTITYDYTDANGCSGSATGTITVEAAPTVALGSLADVCSYVAAYPLSGGTPAGGTYAGPGVSGGNFNPATAGVGTHTITYTYANTTGALCSASATQTITVKNCAGLDESSIENSLAVYPNPADAVVTVAFQTGNAVSTAITMLSVDGKLMYAQQLPQATDFSHDINVSEFPAGIYLINIQTANGSATRRIVVQ